MKPPAHGRRSTLRELLLASRDQLRRVRACGAPAQSVMFSYILAGTNARNPFLSPNNLATSAAAEVGAALTANPDLDLRRVSDQPLWPRALACLRRHE